MFAKKARTLGEEQALPADFATLGLKPTTQGQLHDEHQEGCLFNHRITKRYKLARACDLHVEACKEAVRKHVVEELATHDIKPLYLTADLKMSQIQPSAPHVPILISNLEMLKEKNSVIIICGDEHQDLGIFSHFGCMGKEGMHESSILSVVAHLAAWKHLGYLPEDDKDITYDAVVYNAERIPFDVDMIFEKEDTPGLIILNPGQRIYSHKLDKTFTQASWQARPRKSTQKIDYHIDKQYNLVEHHKTADEHVQTFFNHVLPQIVDAKAKICLIAVNEGANSAIKALDSILTQQPSHALGRQLNKTTLIGHTYPDQELKSTVLKYHLGRSAIAWRLGTEPRGTVIGEPKALFQQASTPPVPTPIKVRFRPVQDVAMSGRPVEISPLALRLQEAKARGEASTNSSFTVSTHPSKKELVPFQNTDFSPPETPAEEFFPMEGTLSMIQKAEEDEVLVDATRQLIAQVRRVPSDVRARTTDWVVSADDSPADPNETTARGFGSSASLGKLADKDSPTSAGKDGSDESDDRVFISGHSRPRKTTRRFSNEADPHVSSTIADYRTASSTTASDQATETDTGNATAVNDNPTDQPAA